MTMSSNSKDLHSMEERLSRQLDHMKIAPLRAFHNHAQEVYVLRRNPAATHVATKSA